MSALSYLTINNHNNDTLSLAVAQVHVHSISTLLNIITTRVRYILTAKFRHKTETPGDKSSEFRRKHTNQYAEPCCFQSLSAVPTLNLGRLC